MKKNKRKKYKGLGFVELLISLAVAAIAVTVLINMTTTSMKEAIRYERHDALTRLAMDGALIVRRHVERTNDPQDTTTPIFSPVENTCYKIELEGDKPVVDFTTEVSYGDPPDYHGGLVQDEDFHTDIVYDKDLDLGDKYYFAYCVDKDDDDLYIGKIVTGFVACENCGVEPYEQAIIVSVNE